nr:Lrp/AsnC family transcriptional regulator [Roseovarius pacificus]
MQAVPLDAIDRKILRCLQENARISNVDLAREVGLSPSPCSRRVRELEESGVVRRYATVVDPAGRGAADQRVRQRGAGQAGGT